MSGLQPPDSDSSERSLAERLCRWRQAIENRYGAFLTAVALIVFGIWAFYLVAVVPGSVSLRNADSTADLLVARAANDGRSPYADLYSLSSEYGIDYSVATTATRGERFTHPRTPGALLLLQPIVLLDVRGAFVAALVITVVSIGAIGASVIPRLTPIPVWLSIGIAALMLFSGPVVRGLQFGSMTAAVVLLVGLTWAASRDGDSWGAGVPLGLAVALRLFPALMIVPIWLYGRRKTSGAAVATFVFVSILGILLLEMQVSEVVDGLAQTNKVWVRRSSNGSLLRFWPESINPVFGVSLISGLVFLGVMVMKRMGISFDIAFGFAAVGSLLASPLSWEHYDILLLLVALSLTVVLSGTGRWLSVAAIGLTTVGYYVRQPLEEAHVITSGDVALFARLVVVGAVVASVLGRRFLSDRSARGTV